MSFEDQARTFVGIVEDAGKVSQTESQFHVRQTPPVSPSHILVWDEMTTLSGPVSDSRDGERGVFDTNKDEMDRESAGLRFPHGIEWAVVG